MRVLDFLKMASGMALAAAMLAGPVGASAQDRGGRGERPQQRMERSVERGGGPARMRQDRAVQQVDRRSEQRPQQAARPARQARQIDRRSEQRAARVEQRGDRAARQAWQQGRPAQARQIDRRSEQRARQIEQRGDVRAGRVAQRDIRGADRNRYDNNRGGVARNNYDNRGGRSWDRGWRNDNRYNWQSYRSSNRNLYRATRYYSPYNNWSYRRLNVGFRLDSLFFGSRYWINDPVSYRLPAAYGQYRWVRYYDDVLLVDIYTGQVVDAIYDFYW